MTIHCHPQDHRSIPELPSILIRQTSQRRGKKKGINITNSRTFRPAIHQRQLWHRFDTVRPGREMAMSLRNPGLRQKSRTLKDQEG
ncbi:uncharacterized protein TNIN_245031 [Trichonephila inaurata madagascariensis]|uniref:Uncharacterized protein n=1 Tax=Trichonephila inaurata madagascariensis TaxID=2747483 RepID=A0A8X6Y4Y5_9ARAC|nr:uncharacterized protein TNIN_245031 [Trichonephila inaurata madagascariensis]